MSIVKFVKAQSIRSNRSKYNIQYKFINFYKWQVSSNYCMGEKKELVWLGPINPSVIFNIILLIFTSDTKP